MSHRWLLILLGALLALHLPPSAARAQGIGSIFESYPVKGSQVPAALIKDAAQFSCQPALMRSKVAAWQLSEEAAIWDLPCAEYPDKNTSHILAIVRIESPEEYRFLTLPSFPGCDGCAPNEIMNPVWTPAKRRLTSTWVGHEAAPCGSYGQYRVYTIDESGEPVLTEYRSKPKCDGKEIPPTQYPRLFPK